MRFARFIMTAVGGGMFWLGIGGFMFSMASAFFFPFMILVALLCLILAGVGGILFWLS